MLRSLWTDVRVQYNVLLQVQDALFYKLDDELTQIGEWDESDLKKHDFPSRSAAVAAGFRKTMLELDANYPIQYPKVLQAFTKGFERVKLIPGWFWNTTDETSAEYVNTSTV